MISIDTCSLPVETKGFTDIIDLSGALQEMLVERRFTEGSMLVFVGGATAGITTIEYESGLIQDIKDFFEHLAPMDKRYHHNERWHDGNGYAHIRAAFLKPSLLIPFSDGRLCLGTWQQIILVDFDNRPRSRQLIVQFQGERT